jgi:D-lactate dehydrogenase
LEQLIKTIAPAWESTKIDSSRQSGEIGSQLRTILRSGRVPDRAIAHGAGVRLFVPSDVQGHCCGVPFSSKGFDRAHNAAANKTIESFFRWSNRGEVPIVLDTSPCMLGLKTCRAHLTPKNQERFDMLKILDSIEFVSERILPKLVVRRRMGRVAVH